MEGVGGATERPRAGKTFENEGLKGSFLLVHSEPFLGVDKLTEF